MREEWRVEFQDLKAKKKGKMRQIACSKWKKRLQKQEFSVNTKVSWNNITGSKIIQIRFHFHVYFYIHIHLFIFVLIIVLISIFMFMFIFIFIFISLPSIAPPVKECWERGKDSPAAFDWILNIQNNRDKVSISLLLFSSSFRWSGPGKKLWRYCKY